MTAQHLSVNFQRVATNNPTVPQKLLFEWELAVPCPNHLSWKEPHLLQLRGGWGQLLQFELSIQEEVT